MDFQFVIPATTSELLNSTQNNYFVSRLYSSAEIAGKLQDAKRSISSGEPYAIFDHFDTFFSIIENAKTVQKLHMSRAYDLLWLDIDNLGKILANLLQKNEVEAQNRLEALNATKMLCYAMIGIVKVIDQTIQAANEGLGKKSKRDMGCEEFENWDEKRFKCLVQLYNLIQLPLEKLWDPPVPEESFVNLIGDIAYRSLEQPSVRLDRVYNTIFQILGTMIKRYNHAITFPVRILQVLKNHEMSISPIANGIVLLYDEFNIQSVFTILIKEMIEILSMDAADTQTARYFGTFLMDMAHAAPKLLIPHLSKIGDELLNSESHVLRNAVFQVMGDVILAELTAEDLNDEFKEIRDEFLEDLLNHIMDVSAHCRSKVLQVWLNLKVNNAVPLSFQYKVLQETVDRLEDKTSVVRKNAITLFKAFLEHNPFSGKLSLEELNVKYEAENEKLQAIRQKMLEQERTLAESDEKWEDVAIDLLPVIVEAVKGEARQPKEKEAGVEMITLVAELMAEKKYFEVVTLVMDTDQTMDHDDLDKMDADEKSAFYMCLMKSYYMMARKITDYNEEFTQQEGIVNFLHDSQDFAQLISDAIPKLQELLMSKTNSDVFEAIDLFTAAYMFGIKGTEPGMRQMLFLVWSPDKEKRDCVVDAYKKVLFTTDAKDPRAHAVRAVQNLCGFIENLTAGQYSAMETLVNEWTKEAVINDQMIQVLFQMYTQRMEGVSDNQARLALDMLTLCSVAKPNIVTANQTLLETFGFENNGIADPRIFASTLQLFMNSIVKETESGSKFYRRYDPNETQMIKKIMDAYEKFFFAEKLDNFDEITMKTFNFIYRMCLQPDELAQSMILRIYERLQNISEKLGVRGADLPATQGEPLTQTNESPNSQCDQPLILPIFLLSRLVYVIGYTAMKEMIYLDIDVYSNLKYRQELKEEKKNAQKIAAHKNNRASANLNASMVNKRKTLTMEQSASATKASNKKRQSGPHEQDDEQLVGATAEDSIAEHINFICENEMLYSRDTLFNKFVPLIREVCKAPGKFKDPVLQQSATLALIRLMAVSSKFCEENMQFLMSIFQHTKHVTIKCNIVIGLSDFTFRFPNVIEPWTGHLYATLHEEDTELRLTAVKMLSHLILHEMIRVKGQISDLAMCIVDPDDGIQTITQQFFREIANKSNILYNVLPDIISRLSDVSSNLEEDKYRKIMKFIIGLIQKDRQVESLVEKLCLRFRVTTLERQWRDIAYCLSLLTYTEKTIKKLIDSIGCFKDKVQIQEVYDAFKAIISATSKLAKPELKAACTEFDTRLSECLAISDAAPTAGESEDKDEDADNDGFKRPKAPAVRGKGKKPPPARTPVSKRPTRSSASAAKKKPVVSDSESSSSSESEEEEEEENQQPKAPPPPPIARRTPKTPQATTSRQRPIATPPVTPSSPTTRRRQAAVPTSSPSPTTRSKKVATVIESDTSSDESLIRPQAKRRSSRRR